MTVSSQAIANQFINLAKVEGQSLTNMQLQKLVFLAQGYALAILGRPLYYHNTHAWQWGPVVPALYKALQKYGSGVVTDTIPSDETIDPESPEAGIIKGVFEAYGHFTGGKLSALTHLPRTPWRKTWDKEPFSVIDIPLMEEYYKKLVDSARG